ncbi:MAG: Urea amidolyase related protein [Synergistales bacterium 54_9]|nr:MAG: Urea amidolyase related protein [Synergistales bacterium 54_9]
MPISRGSSRKKVVAVKLRVEKGGLLTTVQDLGRWGYQAIGMPVAGAMDGFALQAGNLLVGNDPGAAALELTVMGPVFAVTEGEGVFCLSGAEMDLKINGERVPCWMAHRVKAGDKVLVGGPVGTGCRGYFCVSGGIDVPLLMESRSTYLRAKIGGFEGRALKAGDVLETGPLPPLWRRLEGFACPGELRPDYDKSRNVRVVMGPQDDCFKAEGIETFLNSEYTITNEADRMGFRLEGPVIEHEGGADIISDGIPLGAVQVPGHGKPVVMLADRQTTGGYTKIAVVASCDIGLLAQRMPGETVRFKAVSFGDALEAAREERARLRALASARAEYRSAPRGVAVPEMKRGQKRIFRITVDGAPCDVQVEEME